jgi:Zn-dependent M28 family amino/carboxypeptidase
MVGAMRWLDRHAAELAAAPVVAINLDGAGNPGRLALLARYGFGRRFAPALEAAARRAAARLGYPVRRVLMPPGMGIDAIPFAHRGVPCLTIASGALNRATLSIHTARDVADNLDPKTLERAAHLTAELAVDATRP